MSTEKWIAGAGQGLTWGDAIATATLSAIASGNAILSGIVVTNGTALDMFADVSVTLASLACVAPNFVGVYIYPLNSDGSTYGDGRTGSFTGPPSAVYNVGNIGLVAATQAQEGTCMGIRLPPGSFKFVLYNGTGVAFATGSVNTCQYRTYNRSVA